MYCQNCGFQVQPGQLYCPGCERPLTGYGVKQRGRLEQHVPVLGILWIVYSSFSLLAGLAVLTVAEVIFGRHVRLDPNVPAFLHPLLLGVGLYLLFKASAGIAAGIGLRQHADWARVLAIVLSFFELLHLPLGTMLGIYTIWALLSPGAEKEYKALPQAA